MSHNDLNRKIDPNSLGEASITSVLSHNVKSPMIYLQVISEYLISNWDNVDEQEKLASLETVNEAAINIVRLLENLINWAKMQEGKLEPKNSWFNLHELLETELALHKTILHYKKLNVSIDIPSTLKVKSDPIILQLIIHNVLTNAIKFSYKNSVVKIDYTDHESTWVLSIEDEGKGMDEIELESLLEDELNNSTGTFNEQGTGIGTALTISLVQLLDGDLQIKSQLDTGTRVSVSLPKNN